MTRRRGALSFTAVCALVAAGTAAWTFVPTRVRANPPVAMVEPAKPDIWAGDPIDRDYMARGVLDYRTDSTKH